MKYSIYLLVLIVITGFNLFSCKTGTKKSKEDIYAETYIKKYKDIAIREMHEFGIPASIKLAQGILESSYGRSKLTQKANNHFGIKCGEGWNGPTFSSKTKEWNRKKEKMTSKTACFRVYKTAEECYRAHSVFLRDRERYKLLFELRNDDYMNWALGLQKTGYATDPVYAEKLITIIRNYKLYQFDHE